MPHEQSEKSLDAVVAKAYAAIAEPESFVHLLSELIEADEQMGGIGDMADLHFENAESILAKVYPLDSADYTALRTHLEAQLDCDIALDPRLRVLAANPRIVDSEWIAQPDFTSEWLFDPARISTDRARLQGLGSGDHKLFIRLFTSADDESGRWFGAHRTAVEGQDIIALHAVRLRWDERSGAAFQQAMELTPTETELTRHLVTGGKVRDFAEARGTALGTARNQLKALQRKLAINSKEELLLLYAGFIHSLDPPNEAAGTIEHTCPNLFVDPAGGTIAWEEHGDPKGDPVLFFHALEGPLFTHKVDQAAKTARLRIIAPWRPHYGATSGGQTGAGSPMEFAARLPAFLDHLGIERVITLGTQAGTPFLAAFAKSQGERVIAVIAAGPFFPITEGGDYEYLPRRQRIHYRISRVTPAFARVYMRAMLASMGTGEFYKFVEDYYDSCPRELETVQQPQMIRNFRKAANYVLPLGPNGPVDTMLNWSAKWGDHLRDMPAGFHVMLGAEDCNTSPEFARLSANRFGFPDPEVIADAGSFLIEDKPAVIFGKARAIYDGI